MPRLLRDSLAGPALLLDPPAARHLLGLSKCAFYRLVASAGFPAAVDVPGAGPRWRRADLEKWCGKLKAKRRTPKVIEVEEVVEV